MVSRILLVLSAVLVIVHGSESVNGPTGNAPTGNTPKASSVSPQSAPIAGTGPTKLAASSGESASSSGSSSLTSGGNVPKASSFSWDSSSSESKSEPLSASLKPKDSHMESSASSSGATSAALKSDSLKKDVSEFSSSSESEEDSEPSTKPGDQTEMISGSSEESGSHGAQQISGGSGKPNATTPRPVGQSSTNSSVVMTIPTKAPTLLPKQNSTYPIKNNSSSSGSGVQLQAPAQGSAVQVACSGFAILAVSVHLILSH